jgi:diguanylate cyclase (GGDEF)-like protein/PAS domain S-box-containing protein
MALAGAEDIARLIEAAQRQGGPDGVVAQLAAAVLDARAQSNAARAALDAARRRFDATFSQAPVGIAHVAIDGGFRMVNDQFCRITGYSREELLCHGFQQITHPEDLEADLIHVRRLLLGETERYVMEKRYLRKDGATVWINLTVSLVRDTAGQPDFFVSVIEDLSEIRKAHADAMLDSLTGLFNRRGFVDRAAREIARAVQANVPLSLAYLDLDGFKRLNDSHGHSVGDQCLVQVARLLETGTRPGDLLARLGGDEFALLLPNLASAQASGAMDRVRRALVDMGDTHEWPISGSFGILSMIPSAATTPDQLIAGADAAMFRAKHAGKNCIRTAST